MSSKKVSEAMYCDNCGKFLGFYFGPPTSSSRTFCSDKCKKEKPLEEDMKDPNRFSTFHGILIAVGVVSAFIISAILCLMEK